MTGFAQNDASPRLNETISSKIVEFAHEKLQESGVEDLVVQEEGESRRIPCKRHSQISLGRLLGKGAFSTVFEVTSIRQTEEDKNAGLESKSVVVKVLHSHLIQEPHMFAACATDMVKEGTFLATFNHPNILKAQAWAPEGVNSFSTGRHDAFFLVLERVEMTLSTRLRQWQKLPTKNFLARAKMSVSKTASKTWLTMHNERLDLVRQLTAAVKYLHSHGVIHRDMKPDNIGLDSNGTLKIFDFDLARIVPSHSSEKQVDPNETFRMTGKTGSPRYMAPEVARGEPYNLKADVYTTSLLVYEIMNLHKPYSDFPASQFDDLVIHQHVRPSHPSSLGWPESLKTLLDACWSNEICERPSMSTMHTMMEGILSTMTMDTTRRRPKFLARFRPKRQSSVPAAA